MKLRKKSRMSSVSVLRTQMMVLFIRETDLGSGGAILDMLHLKRL